MTRSTPDWLEAVIAMCRNGFDPDSPATGGRYRCSTATPAPMVYRQPIAREVHVEDGEPSCGFARSSAAGDNSIPTSAGGGRCSPPMPASAAMDG
jgi:hypothetical protein